MEQKSCKACKENMKYTKRSNDEKKKLTNRLNIIEGQIRGINQMVKDDRYCGDILIQIAAVNNSLKSLGNNILNNHLKSCVTKDILNGKLETIDEVMELIKKFN